VSDDRSTLEAVIETFASAVAGAIGPLAGKDPNGDRLRAAIAALGWTLPDGAVPPSLVQLGTTIPPVVQALLDLRLIRASNAKPEDVRAKLLAVVTAFGAFAEALHSLSDGLHTDLPSDFVTATDLAAQLGRRLVDTLISSTLRHRLPIAYAIGKLCGILEDVQQPADPAHHQPAFRMQKVNWERIPSLITQPSQILRDVYGWGTPQLSLDPLFDALITLCLILQIPGQYDYASTALVSSVAPGFTIPKPWSAPRIFRLPILQLPDVKLDASIIPIPTASTSELQGMALAVRGVAGFSDPVWLTDSIEITIDTDVGASATLAVGLWPDRPPRIITDFEAHANPLAGHSKVKIAKGQPAPLDPLQLIGLGGGAGIYAHTLYLEVGVDGGASDFFIEVGVESGQLAVKPSSGADSFVQRLLPSNGFELDFDGAIGWSSVRGAYFKGAASLDATLPLSLSAGPLSIDALVLHVAADGSGVTFDAGARIACALGPVNVSLDRVGVTAGFQPTPGNLGPVSLQLDFLPPGAVGVSVDAAAVTGGGFLSHNDDLYEGAVELSICGVAVKAYGLVETKLPSGADGYSFLVVISAEFSPGLQIGSGFTLDGVGGLIGVNRTLALSNVQSAIWSHHFDGLLFPKDPVAAAPTLMSSIESFFPAAQDRYLFGPLVKLGWGSGMVEALLGLIIELPEPLKIVLLGEVDVLVPLQLTQLELHIDFDGGVDFGQKLGFFDASLHDSKIERYPIGGDLAFRYGWGDDPVFALAIGGFNPHYQPPANFPTLRRLTISIGETGTQLMVQGYFALTSNTLQFGARVELTAGADALNVHGWLGFDALVEWNPFAFRFDVSAGVDLRNGSTTLASVHLDGSVSGTSPWHASGDASISCLFFDISVHFDKQWGDTAAPLPAADPTPAVIAAIKDASAWSSSLAAGVDAIITAQSQPTDFHGAVLLDPAGGVRITQRVVPLGQPITRVNGSPLAKALTLNLDSPNVFGQTNATPATEEFALAQFEDLSDSEKLSLPSFTRLNAGVEIGGDAVGLGQSGRPQSVATTLAYDTTIIDSANAQRPGGSYTPTATTQAAMNNRLRAFPKAPSRVHLLDDRWVVAGTADLKVRPDIVSDGSKRGTMLALSSYLDAHPEARDQLQVVLAQEAA
jgi:hypothetical protein